MQISQNLKRKAQSVSFVKPTLTPIAQERNHHMATSSVGSNSYLATSFESDSESQSSPKPITYTPIALISTQGKRPAPPSAHTPLAKKRISAQEYRKEFARRTARMQVKFPQPVDFHWCNICKVYHYLPV